MHEVGEVLFIVSNKRRQIFPVRVVEQVIRKTLSGEGVSYRVQIPGGDKPGSGIVDLSGIDGTVHPTIERAREFLYEQATRAIEQMLETAQEMVSELGISETPVSAPVSIPAPQPTVIPKNGASKMKVRLEDGTSATVTLPEVQ